LNVLATDGRSLDVAMSRADGRPTLDELRQVFAELLVRAVADGEMPPTETGLHPAVLDAIENVARAWPDVPDELIFMAHKGFARYQAAAR
jgi:hypothetical protein